ncbi:MAG: penicillin-binding protein 2 [Planctomycetota bacterium]
MTAPPPTRRRADWASAPTATDAGEARAAKHSLWVGRVLIILVSATLLLLLGRVYQLQSQPHQRIAELRESQSASAALTGRRGALTDRRGRPLATTRTAYRLFIDPHQITRFAGFSETVGYELGYNPAEIELAIYRNPDSRYIVIDHRLTDEQAARFAELNLPGLYTEPVVVRDYPQGPLAGQLIGFVGRDGTGLDGLERHHNQDLAAQPGRYTFLRDHRARRMWLDPNRYTPHTDGQNIRLSLDIRIQAIAEQKLAETVDKHAAASGQIVVMDPATGEVLALAHYPPFDPATFQDPETEAARRLRVVTDVFEPGSTFKTFVWAGLTEMNAADPSETFDCENGLWVMPNRRRLRDAKEFDLLSWSQVLQHSSNIGMAKAAARVSQDDLHRIIAAFGFGQPSGVDLPGEVTGTFRPVADWSSYSMGSLPMGQEISVNAMQLMRAFAAIANHGTLLTPTLHPPGPGQASPLGQRIVSSRTAALARAALRAAVAEDKQKRVESDLYPIFGKSGTAQLPKTKDNSPPEENTGGTSGATSGGGGGYVDGVYVSSFVGGAPLDQPRLVVGCFIHETRKPTGHYGSTVAGPAVKHVLEQSLLYLGVPPLPSATDTDRVATATE